MKILSSCFPHNPRVPFVHVQIGGNALPQFLEHSCAAGEVQSRETAALYGLGNDLGSGTGDELDDAWRDACFSEDLIDEVVGVCCCRGGLPYNDVPY